MQSQSTGWHGPGTADPVVAEHRPHLQPRLLPVA